MLQRIHVRTTSNIYLHYILTVSLIYIIVHTYFRMHNKLACFEQIHRSVYFWATKHDEPGRFSECKQTLSCNQQAAVARFPGLEYGRSAAPSRRLTGRHDASSDSAHWAAARSLAPYTPLLAAQSWFAPCTNAERSLAGHGMPWILH